MNLDDLIAQSKNKLLPECPVQVEKNVLRRIRVEQLPPNSFAWMLPSTGFQLGAIALVMLLTFTSTLGIATLQAKHQSRRNQAAKALNFDVFNDLSLYEAQRDF